MCTVTFKAQTLASEVAEDPIALRIARHCATLPFVRAVGLFGSRAALNDPDDGADWDLGAFTALDGHPPASDREALWSMADSPVRGRAIVREGLNDRFRLDGIHVELEYFTIAGCETALDCVFVDGDTVRRPSEWCVLGECPEAVCADIAICRPTYDPDGVIAAWKERVAQYPAPFRARVMSGSCLQLRYRVKDLARACAIGDAAAFHAALSEYCFLLCRMLYAANRVYFRGIKRAIVGMAGFDTLPADCTERLDRMLRAPLNGDTMSGVAREATALLSQAVDAINRCCDEDRAAIEPGLWDWPDLAVLEGQPLRRDCEPRQASPRRGEEG